MDLYEGDGQPLADNEDVDQRHPHGPPSYEVAAKHRAKEHRMRSLHLSPGMMPSQAPRGDDVLMMRAIAGVMRGAQDGDLPLFAWTLGLPQPALLAMVAQCFPELGELAPLPSEHYANFLNGVPDRFHELVALLNAHRSPGESEAHTDWLARAIAAASFGDRHLWEGLGLSGRDALSHLLARYFEPLYQRNTTNMRWKKFIYSELGARHGDPGLQPPDCSQCDHFPLCFPDVDTKRH